MSSFTLHSPPQAIWGTFSPTPESRFCFSAFPSSSFLLHLRHSMCKRARKRRIQPQLRGRKLRKNEGIQGYAMGHSRGIRGAFNGHSSPKMGHSAKFAFGTCRKPEGFQRFSEGKRPRVRYYNIRREETGRKRRGTPIARRLYDISRILP